VVERRRADDHIDCDHRSPGPRNPGDLADQDHGHDRQGGDFRPHGHCCFRTRLGAPDPEPDRNTDHHHRDNDFHLWVPSDDPGPCGKRRLRSFSWEPVRGHGPAKSAVRPSCGLPTKGPFQVPGKKGTVRPCFIPPPPRPAVPQRCAPSGYAPRHEHTTISGRAADDTGQHARQRPAVARGVMQAVPPRSGGERHRGLCRRPVGASAPQAMGLAKFRLLSVVLELGASSELCNPPVTTIVRGRNIVADAGTREVSKHEFSIAYDGAALAEAGDHSIDVQTLAPALLAFGKLIREANTEFNGPFNSEVQRRDFWR
jgi:hypothetical protein